MSNQINLFSGQRMQMNESIDLTVQSLKAYGQSHKHWVIAWSGGKDSTTLVTLIAWLISSGKVPAPKSLSVLYADTRQEMPPLAYAAECIIDDLIYRGIDVRRVMAPLDRRMWVYILGRGVPPPNNNTLRYCTRMIKIEPMSQEIRKIYEATGEKVLTLTGVRQGESAARDNRIALSCAKNNAECGQGWFQETLPGAITNTLAPLLHWRVCHIWEWLKHWAPQIEFGDWHTTALADAYGGDEAEELEARTGCNCCPLVQKDTALERCTQMNGWAHLKPMLEIRALYRWLREPANRLRKPGFETLKDGSLAKNPQRMGPITLEARSLGLARLLDIQQRVNAVAPKTRYVDLLNHEEEARIRELIAVGTWPDKWDGTEPTADTWLDRVNQDGSIEPLLFKAFAE